MCGKSTFVERAKNTESEKKFCWNFVKIENLSVEHSIAEDDRRNFYRDYEKDRIYSIDKFYLTDNILFSNLYLAHFQIF